MTPLDFTRLREGKSDCPSDLALDRLVAGELEHAEQARIEAHAASCDRCPERIESRRQGWDAVPEIDPRRSLARLRTRLDEAPRDDASIFAQVRALFTSSRRWLIVPSLGAIAAAIVLAFFMRPVPVGPDGDSEVGETRAKGGAVLHVYRLSGARSDEVESGAKFNAGDRLRFVVDLPTAGRVRIVGVEASGRVYDAWPQSQTEDTHRPRGSGQILPGAVELDDTTGRETLWLVHCPDASGGADPRCEAAKGAGSDAAPICPKGCSTSRFVIEKAPR